jgi:hypothetical protein
VIPDPRSLSDHQLDEYLQLRELYARQFLRWRDAQDARLREAPPECSLPTWWLRNGPLGFRDTANALAFKAGVLEDARHLLAARAADAVGAAAPADEAPEAGGSTP